MLRKTIRVYMNSTENKEMEIELKINSHIHVANQNLMVLMAIEMIVTLTIIDKINQSK